LNELDQEAISTEDQVALTTILTTNHTHQTKMDLQKAFLHLRDDHTSLANDLLDLKIRMSKLEDNVRALTAQRTSAQDAPRMAQEIEATTRYGKNVVLKIPKGQALVPLRPSRSPTPSPPNHSADSAPSSQVSEDNVTVDGADQPNSSQSTSEITTQPEDPKVETLEKVGYTPQIESQSLADQQLLQPLPPIPAAAAFPATSYIKQEPLGNAWESGNSQPSSAAVQDSAHTTTTSSWGASTLSAIPPVQIAPDTPRVGEESAPVPRSKGKGKKKWTDPPIFQDSQLSAGGDNTGDTKKTLFSYHDVAEALTTATGTAARSEARQQKVAHPENASPIRDVTNQTMAWQPLEPNTIAHQSMPSRTETSNNKSLFGALLRDNNVNHGQRLPPQSTATVVSAQPTPAPAPASRVFSTPGDMRSMMQSVAPRSNYVATPEAATASKENAVPRAPVNLTATTPAVATASEENAAPSAGVTYKVTAPKVSGRTDASASSDASGSSVKPERIAKRSAVKKVGTGSSTEQAIVSSTQASSLPSPSEQIASTASPAAAPQLPNVSTSTAGVASPAATFRPAVNARVASFQPSTSFTTNVTHTASPAIPGGPIMASLRSQMTAEQFARFSQQTNNVQT